MIKSTALFFIAILIFRDSNSQTHTQKYWHYRDRFFNGFVIMGDGLGYSNVCDIRNSDSRENNITKIYHVGQQSIYMGWYIGVLATEYALLKQRGLSTEKTLTELYYALKTVYRLDELSGQAPPVNETNNFPNNEPYCPQLVSQQLSPDGLNGFFIRDDTPYQFIDPTVSPQRYNQINQRINDFNYGEVEKIESDYITGNKHWDQLTQDSTYKDGKSYAKEMSQDELYHLMMGLALVKHFIPDQALQVKLINGNYAYYNFNFLARHFVHLAVQRIMLNDWLIINPNTGWMVHQGPCVKPLAYGLAEAAKFITGNNYSTDAIQYSVWQGYKIQSVPSSDNRHMIAVLAAIGNSFDGQTRSIGTNNGIYTITNDHEWDSFYGLLRKTLHGGPVNISSVNLAKEQLDKAPCEGPYNLNQNMYYNHGWACSHKFFRPKKEQYGEVGWARGYYNGLDYMLLHNLHYLNYPNAQSNLSGDISLISPNDDLPKVITIPMATPPFMVVGDNNNPAFIQATEKIIANNKINSNANVTYKAGKEITFTDGFEVKYGAEFHAYIDPFKCNFGNNNSQRRAKDDNILNEYVDFQHFERFPEKQDESNYFYEYPVKINYPIEELSLLTTNNVEILFNYRVFPNPTTGIININVQTLKKDEQFQLRVLDVFGKEIINQQVNHSLNHQIDLS
ncbi:MAG: 3-coathanger stack domain-containing protein, partial [Bacteroidia bacterium]